MKIQKSAMTVDGNSVRLSMPFAKIDESQRLVSGYATLDNIDTQGDIVTAEASRKAFARARGNIREMHQPIAVGKMVDFQEDEFYDAESKKFYRGIFVTARVSEGAEDTWKKVIDGTLTGFSIGGEVNDSTNDFNKDAGKTVRYINDYDLTELSLVDNPANQLANVLSIQKGVDTVVLSGPATEVMVENVFICKNDDTVIVNDSESHDCPLCGSKMENAGWFESGNDRSEKVASIVTKFLHPTDKEAAPSDGRGGVGEVFGKNVNKSVDVPEEEDANVVVEESSEVEPNGEEAEAEVEQVDEAEVASEEEPQAETPDEVHDEEDEISKKIDDLHDAVKKTVNESKEETLAKVAEFEGKIDEALSKISDLETKFSEFGPKLEAQKSRLADLEKRLEKVNASDAVRKSADVSIVESTQKEESFWGGSLY